MQFVTNGPEIPNAMLQSHEDGRLVFFCGAGISIPAGLPSFGGLVDSIYKTIGTKQKGSEQRAFDGGEYDRALHLLEMRLPGGRRQMREALWDCLQLKSCTPKALQTHKALLTLGRDRGGRLRLVTTNYDRLFFRAAGRGKPKVLHLAAPYFPPPQKDRWDGIVYLHGLLPVNRDDETALNSLIATSGDFGAAYLHEQRTSRFVSEIMREYDICFLGYRLEDPILRYMVDALAAVRPATELQNTNCWALAEEKEGARQEWEAKGVTPIFYDAGQNHAPLHNTLHAWAKHYKSKPQAKEDIITRYARRDPSTCTEEDDFVGRVLWALSDPSGRPAERFAQLDPAPPLEWLLDAFFRENSPLVPLLSDSDGAGRALLRRLFPWILKHTHDSRLMLWILRQDARQQEQWRKLFLGVPLEHLCTNSALDEEERAYVRKVFDLFRSGLILGDSPRPETFPLIAGKDAQGLAACLRWRKALEPRIALKRGIGGRPEANESRNRLVRFLPEIVFAGVAPARLDESLLKKVRPWLPALARPLQQHLLDALAMLGEMSPGAVSSRHDLSYLYLSSISPSKRSPRHCARTFLMLLLREAWDSLLGQDPPAATRMAEGWFEKPYPTFKRFALYAASKDNVIAPQQWADWLLQDNSYWLWTPETRREVCRLLVLQGSTLPTDLRSRLEEAILAGPPRDMEGEEVEEERYQARKMYLSFLFLKKLSKGCSLSREASSFLEDMKKSYPQLQLEEEQEELSDLPGPLEAVPQPEISLSTLPQTAEAIATWLTESDFFVPGPPAEWRMLCRERRRESLEALKYLFKENIYLEGQWDDAIQIWTDEIQGSDIHEELLQWLLHLEDDSLSQIAPSCSWWLDRCVERGLLSGSDALTTLCRRLLFLNDERDVYFLANENNVLESARLSPRGHAAQALFHLWRHSEITDGAGLQEPYRQIFTELCRSTAYDLAPLQFFAGMYANLLFRVDRDWTQKNLPQLFDWASGKTGAAWVGFLGEAQPFPELLHSLWPSFVACSEHYPKLEAMGTAYIRLAIQVAIEGQPDIPAKDIETIFNQLPIAALPTVLNYLIERVERCPDDSRDTCVVDQVIPFLHRYWPKDRTCINQNISQDMALLLIAARSSFGKMWKVCHYSLGQLDNPARVLYQLRDSDICTSFPNDALDFLEKICVKHDPFIDVPLRSCLVKLCEADPNLQDNATFIRLNSLIA